MGQIDYDGVTLADACRVSPPTVSLWLNKGVIPRGATLVRLCQVLGCNEHYLVHGGNRSAQPYNGHVVNIPIYNLSTGSSKGNVEVLLSDLGLNRLHDLYAVVTDTDQQRTIEICQEETDLIVFTKHIPMWTLDE